MKREQQFQRFLKNLKWIPAKTYSKSAPHDYALRKDMVEQDKQLLPAFYQYIEDEGYIEYFYKRPFKYVNFGEYKYWLMDNNPDNITIINRTLIENRYGNGKNEGNKKQ